MSLYYDPNWPRASQWLNTHSTKSQLAILGAGCGLGSITPGRCDLGPAAIREAIERFSSYDACSDVDLRDFPIADYGNLAVSHLLVDDAFEPISTHSKIALKSNKALILLGGDNSITRPGMYGFGLPLTRCGLITLDAHLDMRDIARGLSNGNPVAALLNDGLPGQNVYQIGIQSFANSKEYLTEAREYGNKIIFMDELQRIGVKEAMMRAINDLAPRVDAIYFDLDLDVMDRAFAPGCPGARPGGLTPADIALAARIAGECPKVRAMDLVELDPELDINQVTAMAAANCVLHFAVGFSKR
jgi:formiminoglutamase